MVSLATGILILLPVLFYLIWLETCFLSLSSMAGRPGRVLWSNTIPEVLEHFNWDGERPLNVVFLTWGSRGDHQPNIALGLELARRGHNVTIMGLGKYRHIIDAC